jgi:beta-lactamase regulating signal transducer with metallopeptidase domain
MLANVTNALAHYAPWLFAIFTKIAVLLLLILLCAQLLRRRSASLRHCLYAAAMAGALMLPLAAAFLPDLRVAVLPSSASAPNSSSPSAFFHAQMMPAAGASPATLPRHSQIASKASSAAYGTPSISQNDILSSKAKAAPIQSAFSHVSAKGLMVLIWMVGCVIFAVRILGSTLRLRALVGRAVPVESIQLASHLRWLCRDLGIRREVAVLASSELDVPIAVGVLDPKIILSPQSGEWTETRRKAVLCHELAHIKRLDALTQFLARVAAAIYWFNPLVWLVLRAMRAERERACDDVVLAFGTPASEYAHELLEIVSTLVRPQPAAALAMARRSQLEGRVLSLLNPRVAHGLLRRRVSIPLSCAVLAAALPLAAARLQERPASTASARAPESKPNAAAFALATSGSSPSATGPEPFEPLPQPAIAPVPFHENASSIDVPTYPNAIATEHRDGRGTVSLIDGAQVQRLVASAYVSSDRPEKVLQFYRHELKSYGEVIECGGGTNGKVDIQLNESALADPSACRASEFAKDGTEFKVGSRGEQRIVVVLPYAHGSEIALVRYTPDFRSREHTLVQREATNSGHFDCFDGKSVEQSSVNSHTDDGGNRAWAAAWSGPGCSIDAHSIGTVRFNAEATAIESISSGGYFEVNERQGDSLRHLRVEPGANGQLNFTYNVNGTQQEYDAGARAWFSNFLLALERTSGFAASTRVPALLAKGGPQAVLAEISNLNSDYVRQIYFVKLFENATLPGPLLVKALQQARDEISTDYSLAQVLLTIAQHYDLNDEAQRVAFLNGANKLGTDYEHSRVLIELLKRPNLSPQLVRATLESAKSINTDYEKGRILTTLAGLSSFNEGEIATYLDLAGSINTDYEHSRTLMTLMDHQKLSSAAVSQVLKSASSIDTDYEKSRILLAVNESHNFDEKQIATYLSLVESIGTDYERSRDLIALMQKHKLANDSMGRIIAESAKIGTDYEKARVLTEAAAHYEMQGALRDAYIKAADSIGTEYDRNRTLAAITKRETL